MPTLPAFANHFCKKSNEQLVLPGESRGAPLHWQSEQSHQGKSASQRGQRPLRSGDCKKSIPIKRSVDGAYCLSQAIMPSLGHFGQQQMV